MGNQIYAFISHSTVLLYALERGGKVGKLYEENKDRIEVRSDG
jgi:hypothetical protein